MDETLLFADQCVDECPQGFVIKDKQCQPIIPENMVSKIKVIEKAFF
jgi:hypothetical protein